jgi:hypothetical protein
MWYDAFTVAYKLYVEVIEMLLTIAPVYIQYNPSNHDFVSGFMLAQSVQSWFRNNNNIVGIIMNITQIIINYMLLITQI